MGLYINPKEGTKELWLKLKGGNPLRSIPKEHKEGTKFVVCLVNNGLFNAHEKHMKKELTICLNCKHCKKAFTHSRNPTWEYICLVSPFEDLTPVNLVTGQKKYAEPGYSFCIIINTKGNCRKFVPGENQCKE